jgi:hypothetical protein
VLGSESERARFRPADADDDEDDEDDEGDADAFEATGEDESDDDEAGATWDGSEMRPATALRTIHVVGFGISRKKLEQAVRSLDLPVVVVREVEEADALITLRNYYRQKAPALREAEARALPIFVLKSNSDAQIEACLTSMFALEVDPQRGGAARDRGGDRPGDASGEAGRAVTAERVHPAPPAPDGRAEQPRVAFAWPRTVPARTAVPAEARVWR